MNRLELRNLIRPKIGDWPNRDQLAQDMTDSAILLYPKQISIFREGDDIEISSLGGTEVMKVVTVDLGNNRLEVTRGIEGTIPIAHLTDDWMNVYFIWSDLEINNFIATGIRSLRPGVFLDVIDTSLETISGQTQYALPLTLQTTNGRGRVKKVELETYQSSGMYTEDTRWQIEANNLIFNYEPSSCLTIKLTGWNYQDMLTDDTTDLDLDTDTTRVVEFIVNIANAEALESLLSNRVKYTKYSAIVNDRASTSDEINRAAFYFRNQAEIIYSGMEKSIYRVSSRRTIGRMR